MVFSEREAGKSTLMVKLIYEHFRKTGLPSIVIRRRSADITEQYLYDTFVTIPKKFTDGQCPEAQYTKGNIQNGMVDIKLCGKIFCRVIALSSPLMRLKSACLIGLKFMMLDEAVINVRQGEKWLDDEAFRLKELYTTYNRECYQKDKGKSIIFIAFGNPYSYYTPLIADWMVNINLLHPGAILTGDIWYVECYQICEELKQKIMRENPLFRNNSIYTDYAMKGIAVNDSNLRIIDKQPKNFPLQYCFRLHGKTVGIYRGWDDELDLHYWVSIIDASTVSKRRDIICYDFGDMLNEAKTVLGQRGKKDFALLKQSVRYRQIAHRSAEEANLTEELYQLL